LPRFGCWFLVVFITRHSISERSNGTSKADTNSLIRSAEMERTGSGGMVFLCMTVWGAHTGSSFPSRRAFSI
jgi:hypothetical protein